jgi:hypothetical protein
MAVITIDDAESLPPVRLVTVWTGESSTWSREEIYGDEGR